MLFRLWELLHQRGQYRVGIILLDCDAELVLGQSFQFGKLSLQAQRFGFSRGGGVGGGFA